MEIAMSENLPVLKQDATTEVGFATAGGFELIQRQAKALATSELIPKEYQGKIQNCIVALEIAHRIGASPLMVMQNLYLVHGKPSWSSQFIIGAINSTGKFTPLRFKLEGEGDQTTCIAWAKDGTGEVLESPPVSIQMAKDEGWYAKNGSKWKTMPLLMLRYRAATFFGRLYAPEILMGMMTAEEAMDVNAGPARKAEILERFGVAVPVDEETGEILEAEPVSDQKHVTGMVACPKVPGDMFQREHCETVCADRLGCEAFDD